MKEEGEGEMRLHHDATHARQSVHFFRQSTYREKIFL